MKSTLHPQLQVFPVRIQPAHNMEEFSDSDMGEMPYLPTERPILSEQDPEKAATESRDPKEPPTESQGPEEIPMESH